MSTKPAETAKTPEYIDIRIRKVDGKKKDGTAFTAFETTDKNKNRLSVRFTENCTPAKPTESCVIRLRNFNVDYWLDKRKLYPILRVKAYEPVIEDLHKETENPFI